MGKSTVIQSLLLLAQSKKSILSDETLCIKGRYVNLGTGQDILYEKAEEDEIGIGIQADKADYQHGQPYLTISKIGR